MDETVKEIYARFFYRRTNPPSGTVINETHKVMLCESKNKEKPLKPYTGGFPSPSPDYPQPIEITDQPVTVTIKGGTEQQSITLTPPRPFTKWDKLEKVDGVWCWVYQHNEYTVTVPVSDDVVITSVLVRKMQILIVRVTPVNSGFNVKVLVDGGTPVEYASFQSIHVPVGATVEAWAQVTAAAPEGYELSSFPGTGEKESNVLKTVPLTTDLYLSAVFSLKEFPLNVKVVPDNGGRISLQDNAGNYYAKG